jgi:hypothetical protein
MVHEPVLALVRFTRALEALSVQYLVGGSFASSVFGAPRSTQDADVVAEITLDHVDPLHRRLERDFFVDARSIRDAIRDRSSFNILDRTTMFKVDVFISPDDEWSRTRLARARPETIETSAGPVVIRFSAPEDTLLHKLLWYRLGNEVSDRQWEDVLGLLKVQGSALDSSYLDRWAPELGVHDLLGRARAQSTRPGP